MKSKYAYYLFLVRLSYGDVVKLLSRGCHCKSVSLFDGPIDNAALSMQGLCRFGYLVYVSKTMQVLVRLGCFEGIYKTIKFSYESNSIPAKHVHMIAVGVGINII